jgi:flagellar biosynthesis/type III secretory pathway protein FliH
MPSSSSRVLERPPLGPRPSAGPPPERPMPVIRPVEPVRTEAQLLALEREAYEAGFAAGERAGRETGEAAARRLVAAIEAVRGEIEATRAQLVPEAEHEVLHLGLAVARAVVGYEVAADHPVVVAGMAAAREHFSARVSLTIRIHPEDRAVLEEQGREVLERVVNGFELVNDPGIGRGGAVVEGEGKVIDAGLVTRFEEVVGALVERISE